MSEQNTSAAHAHHHVAGNNVPLSKRRRGTRDQFRRGVPKKGGGGGKGTWGKPGDEFNEPIGAAMDSNDPNYDEDTATPVVLEKHDVQLTLPELETTVAGLLDEYYNSNEASEVINSLVPLNFDPIRHELVPLAIVRAMDNKDAQREQTSELLSEMYNVLLTETDYERGFATLLDRLDDLQVDIPEASMLAARFIARAIADDLLPPKFLTIDVDLGKPAARQAVAEANVLLNRKHGLARLSEIWGGTEGGGFRPVKQLMNRITAFLEEYFLSNDKEEAIRCLAELETPHFHHEVVYELTFLAMERTETERQAALQLLQAFDQNGIVTKSQILNGLERFANDLSDISLDIPTVHTIFATFAQEAQKLGFVSAAFVNDLPSKGRKRFVSENDGGAAKN